MLKGSSSELKGFNCKNIRRNSRGDSVISMLNSFKASRSPEKHRETRYRRYLEKIFASDRSVNYDFPPCDI